MKKRKINEEIFCIKQIKLPFNIFKMIFKFLDLKTKIILKYHGFNIDCFLNFKDNHLIIFKLMFNKINLYYKTVYYCLFKGCLDHILSEKLYLIEIMYLKYFNKLQTTYVNLLKYKNSRKILVHLGSFLCFKKEFKRDLDEYEILTFLNCYFYRINQTNKICKNEDKLIKVMNSLSSCILAEDCFILLNFLLKSLPKNYLILFCKLVHKSELFHLIDLNIEFVKLYFNQYPFDVFKSCVKNDSYLQNLSLSLINWNNNLLPFFFEKKSDILILISLFYINKDYEKSEKVQKTHLDEIKKILFSGKFNKFVEFVNYLKQKV